MDEFEEAKEFLDKLWTEHVEEAKQHELNVPKLDPMGRIQDFFLYVTNISTYCYIHNRNEIARPDGRVCFECEHSYPNDEAIREAFQKMLKQVGEEGQILPNSIVVLKGDTVDDIGFCPLCLHDW
jgi:hypothetical protein